MFVRFDLNLAHPDHILSQLKAKQHKD